VAIDAETDEIVLRGVKYTCNFRVSFSRFYISD